jgi:hypothetical protein
MGGRSNLVRIFSFVALASLSASITAPGVSAVARTTENADGLFPGQETIEGAFDLISKLKDLLKKDAKVGVWVSGETDGPDNPGDDHAFGNDDDKDDIKGESNLSAAVIVEAMNDKDDPPTDNPYNQNPSHIAQISLEAECTSGCKNPFAPSVWRLVANSLGNGFVMVMKQDDNDEINVGETSAAAASLFSEDGKKAQSCFKAEVTNKKKNGKLEDFATQDVKKVKKESCSPKGSFKLVVGGYFLADEDMFDFTDQGNDRVRIVPQFGPFIDLFHTYWQRQETGDLFPVLRGHAGLHLRVRRDLYQERIAGTNLHLDEDPAARADLTVVGAGLSFAPLEVSRTGRTDAQLLEEYFTSSSVQVVPPQHAQEGYVPRVEASLLIHDGDDVSAFAGRPFVLPANNRPGGQGPDDPMVGVLFSVAGSIERAVELAADTPTHVIHRRLARAWDGSRTLRFSLSRMAIHHELGQSLASSAA